MRTRELEFYTICKVIEKYIYLKPKKPAHGWDFPKYSTLAQNALFWNFQQECICFKGNTTHPKPCTLDNPTQIIFGQMFSLTSNKLHLSLLSFSKRGSLNSITKNNTDLICLFIYMHISMEKNNPLLSCSCLSSLKKCLDYSFGTKSVFLPQTSDVCVRSFKLLLVTKSGHVKFLLENVSRRVGYRVWD